MPTQTPQHFFRIHLLTCILLMLAAAAMLGINVQQRQHLVIQAENTGGNYLAVSCEGWRARGWPALARRESASFRLINSQWKLEELGRLSDDLSKIYDLDSLTAVAPSVSKTIRKMLSSDELGDPEWLPLGIALNALTALAILTLLAFPLEYLFRHKTNLEPQLSPQPEV